jgi:hypothetical protein
MLSEQGLVAFSAALGQMHAATAGHATEYYQLRRRHGPVDPAFDRISIFGIDIERAFRRLQVEDRVAYTEAKSPFIWKVIAQADEWAQQTGWLPGPSDV